MSASFCYFAKRMPQACPLHTPLIMKRSYTYLLPAVVLCLMPACGGKKSDTQTANADSVMTTRTTAIAADPHWESEKQVNWNGQTYQIRIERTPARDLPVITDELGQQFYDNRVELTITRNGAPFYHKVFSKEAFADFLSAHDLETGVLQGMAYDDIDKNGEGLRFGAQVGIPGEDGIPLVVTINSSGMASIVQDNVLDTSGHEPEE